MTKSIMKPLEWTLAISVMLLPMLTGCSDSGERPLPGDDLMGSRSYWRNIHANGMNTDEVSIALASKYRPGWVAEKDMMIVSGVVFDQTGNVYFSPMLPKEEVVLVSLEPRKGMRRWALEGTSYGAGSPMVLDDPDHGGEQVVYLGLYSEAMAVKPDGTLLWRKPTGLVEPQYGLLPLCFGVNYHPQSDTVLGLTVDGYLYALDRKTGNPVLDVYSLPGGRSPSQQIPPIVEDLISIFMPAYINQLKPFFSGVLDKEHIFALMNVMGGYDLEVANFFAIDPNSGRIWIVATAADDADGKEDGMSEKGALYGIDLIRRPKDPSSCSIGEACRAVFEGSSNTTPSLKSDGTRIYVGDGAGKLVAFSDSCERIWEFQLPFVASSVAVSSENDEIYVHSSTYIKVKDHGSFAEIEWLAPLNDYQGSLPWVGRPLIGPALGANGVYGQVGVEPLGIIHNIGLGLLDRDTGAMISFKKGLDETSAVICVGPDGGAYIPHSPFRRALAKAVLPWLPPLMGGVGKFETTRLDLLVRDAACAAGARAERACVDFSASVSVAGSRVRSIESLIEQCENTSGQAIARGDLSRRTWADVPGYLTNARTDLLGGDFCSASTRLKEACSLLSGSASLIP